MRVTKITLNYHDLEIELPVGWYDPAMHSVDSIIRHTISPYDSDWTGMVVTVVRQVQGAELSRQVQGAE
jgi:hypothetical protein